jgi:hypothetical protein
MIFGLQDGRRHLVEIVGWLRWKPGHPVTVGARTTGAPRAGLWPWEALPGTPAPDQLGDGTT